MSGRKPNELGRTVPQNETEESQRLMSFPRRI